MSRKKERVLEVGKSFWIYANSKESGCFSCAYCVLSSIAHLRDGELVDGFNKLEIGVPPTKIDSRLDQIPVSVNNALGDPIIQWQDTIARLDSLAEHNHVGPVAIITKGSLDERKVYQLKRYLSVLKLVVLQSISGLGRPIEPDNLQARIHNIRLLTSADVPVIAYLRPIIPGYNDDLEKIDYVLSESAEAGVRHVSYAGLMGKKEVIERLNRVLSKEMTPPEGFSQWEEDKKLISSRLRLFIESRCRNLGLEVYRRTSCAVTNILGLPYDYNLHMYRPDKYNCNNCANRVGCYEQKDHFDKERVEVTLDVLKTQGVIQKNTSRTPCPLKEACNHSLPTCYTDELFRLILQGSHTMGEIALARWLAAIPVTADQINDTTLIDNIWDV